MSKQKKSLYKFVNGKRVPALDPITCPVCEKEFQPKESTRKYCSRECYYEMKRIRKDRVEWTEEMRKEMSERYKGEGNPMYGKEGPFKGKERPDMQGENHPNWKGGWVEEGYKYITVGGEAKREHRHIMEKELGRELKEKEVVHHKNGDTLDNDPDNLEVMTRAEHINEHREDLIRGKREKLSNSTK